MAGDEQFVFRAIAATRQPRRILAPSRARTGSRTHPLDRGRASLPWPRDLCSSLAGSSKKSLIKIPVLLSLLAENVDEAGKTRREKRERERGGWRLVLLATDSVTSRENVEINKPWRGGNISKAVLCSRRARSPSFIRRLLVFESFLTTQPLLSATSLSLSTRDSNVRERNCQPRGDGFFNPPMSMSASPLSLSSFVFFSCASVHEGEKEDFALQ